MSVQVKNMGIITPQVGRGVDSHATHRQSMLTLDGPSNSGALYAHDLVMVVSANGMPAFQKLPEGNSAANTVVALNVYTTNVLGLDVAALANDTLKFAAIVEALRARLGIVWNGTEHVEMPLINNTIAGMDASNDAVFMLRDGYVKNVLTGIPVANLGSIVIEAPLAVILAADGKISLGATGSEEITDISIPIEGTQVINAYTVTNNAGEQFVAVDFLC